MACDDPPISSYTEAQELLSQSRIITVEMPLLRQLLIEQYGDAETLARKTNELADSLEKIQYTPANLAEIERDIAEGLFHEVSMHKRMGYPERYADEIRSFDHIVDI